MEQKENILYTIYVCISTNNGFSWWVVSYKQKRNKQQQYEKTMSFAYWKLNGFNRWILNTVRDQEFGSHCIKMKQEFKYVKMLIFLKWTDSKSETQNKNHYVR